LSARGRIKVWAKVVEDFLINLNGLVAKVATMQTAALKEYGVGQAARTGELELKLLELGRGGTILFLVHQALCFVELTALGKTHALVAGHGQPVLGQTATGEEKKKEG
jgi:hypothetical protein